MRTSAPRGSTLKVPVAGKEGRFPENHGIEDLLWAPEGMAPSLRPRNLLGAMYVQFYWLVASAGDLSRCKHCNRIISYASPIPGSRDRKPRKDKEFCDKRCRQNYHYHNRIKPSPQSN